MMSEIVWETHPTLAAARFQGHSLKVNEWEKKGQFEARMDGEHLALRFVFKNMGEAKAACELAVRKLPPR